MAMLQNHQRSFSTDKITFRKDQITQIITVLDIPDNRVSAKLVDIYRVMTHLQTYQHLELLKLSKEHYRKKWYRPTYKKKTEETSTNLVMKLKQKKTTLISTKNEISN
jgi:hypothetical protein